MMMDPDRFTDALYATPPLEAVEGMLCANSDGRVLPFDSTVARTCTGPERLVAVRRPLRNTKSYVVPLARLRRSTGLL